MVKEYQSVKYLTMAKRGTENLSTEDIRDVCCERIMGTDQHTTTITNVRVIGEPYLNTESACNARLK